MGSLVLYDGVLFLQVGVYPEWRFRRRQGYGGQESPTCIKLTRYRVGAGRLGRGARGDGGPLLKPGDLDGGH